jgi:hypothetical protein
VVFLIKTKLRPRAEFCFDKEEVARYFIKRNSRIFCLVLVGPLKSKLMTALSRRICADFVVVFR